MAFDTGTWTFTMYDVDPEEGMNTVEKIIYRMKNV